ncbi:MAG: hypothetical protein HQK81_10070 [Desulfovibrionaceae bacterium]|nr:hypothetical protein [Desulfovibrionaceae bacterium]MBF0514386.1 hypothetical protein [Desulfovibrionaceae bacterium]
MPFAPRFLATAIGSLPHENPDAALDIVMANLPEAPIWPQLPRRAVTEQMEIQYSQGMPRAVVDQARGKLIFDATGDYSEELAAFYETYLTAMDPDTGDGDCAAMAIDAHHAAGLHGLLARLAAGKLAFPLLKVQVTGPVSFALTTTDQDKRAIYYNDEFLDVIVKALAMKCRWQIRTFAPYASRIICFVDEPILSAFGSSTYVSVTRDDVVARIGEVVEAVHAEGALAGVHCCGNTEWSILIDAGADIVNFDAFCYGETVLMYAEALKPFLERGGCLAFGLVPTSAAVREQTAEGLAGLYENLAGALAATGIDKQLLAERTIVTPACGTGSLATGDAERIFALNLEVSRLLRTRYGFDGVSL